MQCSSGMKPSWDILAGYLQLVEGHCQVCPPKDFTDLDITKRGYIHTYDVIQDGVNISPKEEKSDVLSKQMRNDGNSVFVQGDNEEAFIRYTKAVCLASPDSEEMALAYANRSAATYALGKFNDCIRDIGRSLSNPNYPDHLKHKLYERRGKCFKELLRYPEAAADFERAIEKVGNHEKAREKISQITQLLNDCQGRPDLSEKCSADPLQLSHGRSPKILCASVAVDIGYSKAMGRGIIAARNITPGDVLAIEEKYVSALYPQNFLSHCDNCMKTSFSTIPCLSCNTVAYCSETCRQSSWDNFHSVECRILPTLLNFFLPSHLKEKGTMKAHLTLRLFLLASKCGREFDRLLEKTPGPNDVRDPSKLGFVDGKYLSDDYSTVRHLVMHLEKYNSGVSVVFAGIAVYLLSLLKQGTAYFESLDTSKPKVKKLFSGRCPDTELRLIHLTVADLLLKFYMMITANSREIEDPISFKGVGGGIFPFYSLFNHSCNPDISLYPHGNGRIFVFAIQPVKKGKQIFGNCGFSYEDQTRAYRRKHLALLHHFTCRCEACLEDWPQETNWPPVPTFLRPDSRQSLADLAERVVPVIQAVKSGCGSQEDFDILVRFVVSARKNVRLPWVLYNSCQDAIKIYRGRQSREFNLHAQ